MDDDFHLLLSSVKSSVETCKDGIARLNKHVIDGNGMPGLLQRTAEVEVAIKELNDRHRERIREATSSANRRATYISIGIAALAGIANLLLT